MFSVFKKGFSDPNKGHSVKKVKRRPRSPSAKTENDTVQPPRRKQKHQVGLLACKSSGTVSRVDILATKQTAFGRKVITYNLFHHLIVVMFVDDHERPPSRGEIHPRTHFPLVTKINSIKQRGEGNIMPRATL